MEDLVNTREAVAPWCSIDLSSGNLTVVLEPFNCFDAEVYADDLDLEEKIDFREDQRSMLHNSMTLYLSANSLTVSLGRWVLRYLFANLIDEEIKRDETHRQKLNEEVAKKQAAASTSAPTKIPLPSPGFGDAGDAVATPRGNGVNSATTPGIGIALATPGVNGAVSTNDAPQGGASSGDNKDGYFVAGIAPVEGETKAGETTDTKASTENTEKPKEKEKEKEPEKSKEKEKDKDKEKSGADGGKSPSTPFGKKFRMSFSTKKLGRSPSQATQEKPVVVDEKAVESESSSNHEKEVDDSFFGVIQKIRHEYDKQLSDSPDKMVETGVTPSLATDTPVLKLPTETKIMIQEETSGGSSNVYQGTVESVGRDADTIEQKAPMWLGDVLLQNQIPYKDPVKISFVLHPMDGLPTVSTDGSSRLNANRMLRVKKILAYVAERIEPPPGPDDIQMSPEDYLELYCNEQVW